MIRKFLRLIYIFYIINRYCLLNEPIRATKIRSLKLILLINPFYYSPRVRKLEHGVRIREALEKLGPIFIKFGQALSVRADLLPPEVIKEVSKLQDNVPPFDNDIAAQQIEKAAKKPINKIFKSFESTPLASASVAQVHGAVLQNDEKVVVKVLRPGIEKILKLDTSLMLFFATLLSKLKEIKRFKPVEIVKEINQSFFDELDLVREASNASQIRRNFEGSTIHYVPKIYWEYTSSTVMVMERVSGVRVSDIETLDALGVDRRLLAQRGVEIFYSQVFDDCFFHADMHPGNMFIDVTNPADPKYISIDFGIVGTLNRDDQRYLAGNFLAFFKRDYRKVAELHIESGWVPSDTREDVLESAIRTVCEPIFEKPMKEISLGYTLMQLFAVARRFNMNIQPQLTLLQKTLFHVEGLGQKLCPELNIWETSRPILEKWMKEQMGLRGFYHRSLENMPRVSDKLPELPRMVFDILQQTQINLKAASPSQITSDTQEPKKKHRFALGVSIVLIATGAIASVTKDTSSVIKLQDLITTHSTTILIAGVVCLAYYIFKKEK
ncbi:ubiquinone biosynthesis regulatory protein kinase UbiB [Francisella philomiragia]|uniref:2-octaprenylphenol hydroxylase n=1 Tax=Francisella philomiragia subsp. philomiragia (strain ATCC 25017 / CCUG 19701 / FSC 153 / O\|nr:ubiquinone biosynthesis regulatory protein kinase UbiB [Francisella philomiragia]AJI47543.1 2-polyprenylphenol 6-hydroxylase [Francisella philomiragia]AJI49255.1 2-polyprenylphenol 6-hydroxylase [Francisella philomiragia]MBK2021407.1 ubiquinone biosynthesis regulatory protein kinase UbiB [Francisella philomiragia]MBK2031305.1 ubiquinone biosynthesis regulatory protein kinase UbiB [Francisella philomiragia]MBK2106380.1 ubiquinone biosynthesis regulatory protein kinase UbiB [Francisella philo